MADEADLVALDDRVVPFTVPDLDVRGRVVRLGPSLDRILDRHDYPEPVARVLGEAAALTVLLGTALKFEGRFQLQTKSDGPISMMVVDFNAPDSYRAVAHVDEAKLEEAIARDALSTGDLLGDGHLAMTVDLGEQNVLTVLRTEDLQLVNTNRLPDAHREFVGHFRRRRKTMQAASFARRVIGAVDCFLHVAAGFL